MTPRRGTVLINGRIRSSLTTTSPRQLVVPASDFTVVSETAGALEVANRFGTWSASAVDRPLSADDLWLKLPVGTQAGDHVEGASWNRPAPLPRRAPAEVLDTYRGALRLEEPGEGEVGLRSPSWERSTQFLGTGRRSEPNQRLSLCRRAQATETMLGLLVTARPRRLLVIVPSDALREQIAGKFDRLGVLQELGSLRLLQSGRSLAESVTSSPQKAMRLRLRRRATSS